MKVLVVLTILGAGIVTGLLFAFSNFVMSALKDLPNDKGMYAMQQINKKIINPIFMFFFLGTPILCIFILFQTLSDFKFTNDIYLTIGAFAYLLGSFGITMLFNVPLNNQLETTNSSDADTVWPDYQNRWQKWNHIRTYVGIVAILLLSVGLALI